MQSIFVQGGKKGELDRHKTAKIIAFPLFPLFLFSFLTPTSFRLKDTKNANATFH
jgi:hypothetical protein